MGFCVAVLAEGGRPWFWGQLGFLAVVSGQTHRPGVTGVSLGPLTVLLEGGWGDAGPGSPHEAGWRAGDTCVDTWVCLLPPGGTGRWTPSLILADVTGAGGALGLGGPRDVLPGPLGHPPAG